MIRAIIFDCFGVLCTEGWIPFKRHHFADDPSRGDQATELSRQLNAGLMSYDDFKAQVAALAGVTPADVSEAMHSNAPDEDLFEYIRTSLKPHYKLGILSNAGGDYLSTLFTQEQLALFDQASLSFATGHIKPDSQAYLGAAAALGVRPEECVFIDDQERHCTGALGAGMHAVLYSDPDQLQRELKPFIQSGNPKN